VFIIILFLKFEITGAAGGTELSWFCLLPKYPQRGDESLI
jgi:hypothetical protein